MIISKMLKIKWNFSKNDNNGDKHHDIICELLSFQRKKSNIKVHM